MSKIKAVVFFLGHRVLRETMSFTDTILCIPDAEVVVFGVVGVVGVVIFSESSGTVTQAHLQNIIIY